MKAIAFYLPQFHEVPENSKWWGKGYTEWVAVKRSKPLFFNHYQPTEPLKDFYYDLSNVETLKWQVELAKRANLYGFCFYHYWFSGKLLLEKPAELFLNRKDLDCHFCFSWANETWKRTWSRDEGNDWNECVDGAMKQKATGVLMKQEYGGKREWIEHFAYLLKFFKDERYIKVDNKPVLILYKARNIKCLHSMMRIWDALAKENGYDGMYIISTNDCELQNKYIQADLLYEPAYSLKNERNLYQRFIQEYIEQKRGRGKKITQVCSYRYTWLNILKRDVNRKRKVFLGGFVNFDNTPRRGKNAWLYIGATPKRFRKYLKQLVEKSEMINNEFVFITAWNEWGEGAYLEPDKKHGYKYVDAIRICTEEK